MMRQSTTSSHPMPPNAKSNSKNTRDLLYLPINPKITSSFWTKVVHRLRNRLVLPSVSSKTNCYNTFSRARSMNAERRKLCRSSKSAFTRLGLIIKSKLVIPSRIRPLISPRDRTSIEKTLSDTSAKSRKQSAKGTATKMNHKHKNHQLVTIISHPISTTKVPKRRFQLLYPNRRAVWCSN